MYGYNTLIYTLSCLSWILNKNKIFDFVDNSEKYDFIDPSWVSKYTIKFK